MAVTPNYDLDIDSTLGGDNASDYVIPSQKAIKSYIDNSTGSTVDQVYDPTSQAAQSGIAIAGANFLTSSDLADYVTINTDQDITGVKTYVGQKRIGFKQSGSSDKLGFTLYNNNNVEKGYLEFNPTNTIDGAPLMTLGNYATAAAGITHVGFRKYSSISGASGAYNLLAPLISNAKTPFNLTTTYTNFYLPLGFTDGTTMVTTANTGVVDLSSLLPDVSNFVTNSSLATTLADYQPLLISGTSIKTINNTSLLGSGDVSVLQNTATGTNSLSLLGTASSKNYTVNIGYNSQTGNNNATAIGYSANASAGSATAIGKGATASGSLSTAIGTNATASNNYAIQLGYGTNSTASTLAVGFNDTNYQLLDGTTGLIPDARISTNIARTSDIPTDFTGADSVTAGASGLVPAPAAGDEDKILTGGATWSALKTINNTSLLGSGNVAVQPTLVSGTNIKTINGTSLLGSGTIVLPSIDDTTFRIYVGAKYYWYNNSTPSLWYAYTDSDTPLVGDLVIAYDYGSPTIYHGTVSSVSSNSITISSNVTVINGMTFYRYSTLDEAGYYKLVDEEDTELNIKSSYLADTTLSNVSSIDSGSAVQTALDGKVNKAGDTMTGSLNIQCSNNLGVYLSHSDVTKGTNPSATKYWQVLANDSSNSSTWQSTRLGFLEWSLDSSGTTYMNLAAIENTADSTNRAQLTLSRTQAGVASATINCALTVQNTINTTGNITITKNGTSQFYAKNSGFNYTSTASTATTVGQFYALDTNSKVCGGLSVQHSDSNNATTTVVARRSISGTEKSAYITLGVDSSGNPYATAPVTPAASSNSTNIATTAFVHNACDGQWVDSRQAILDDDSLTQSSSTSLPKTVTLPNDGYKYEVVFRGQVTTGSTSGNYIMLTITGNESSYGSYCCGCRTRTNSTMFARGECSTIMSYGSSNLTIARNSAFAGTASLDVIRYRRIGKNP